ncbi:MAG: hypothetical protein CVT86_03020 [Alphaproteobacteria bacterium HGW-Alphaproteobacteria-8]|nr:MAG: hypothetical protein CVT86_03020 [Alphaproteobacteria bacterium HGW-Alphaproteobacteria-8]
MNTIAISVPNGDGVNLDQLRVATAPTLVDDPITGDPPAGDAQIAIQSLDPAYFDDRLHFSWLDNNSASAKDRDYKESGTVKIGNEGSDPLVLKGYEIDGPFKLADPGQLDGLVLQPGETIDVVVNFDRAAYVAPTSQSASGVFTGALRLLTNDASDPETVVALGGFWQARDEGGWEPSVNEVWEAFGFGTFIPGVPTNGWDETGSPLNNKDIYEAATELEVLSPYWQLADGVTEARITQIAAFHGAASSGFSIHAPGVRTDRIGLSNHSDANNQSFLPLRSNGDFATRTITAAQIPDIWIGDDTFGFNIDGYSSDPTLNSPGPGSAPAGVQRGHFVRFFQALEADGDVIENVYLMLHDYAGVNYDYNDNMYVIEGVKPVSGAPSLAIAGLDDAFAGDGLALSRIEKPRNSAQEFRDVATFEIVNDGSAALTIHEITIGDPSAFKLVGTAPTSIAAGQKATVTVAFTGVDGVNDNKAVLYESDLTIRTNAGTHTIDLGGVAQLESENFEEPTVAQIVKAFGYTTDIAQGALSNGGRVEAIGDEVLAPYLRALDASKPVEIIQIAAYLQANNVARTFVHDLSSAASATELFAQDGQNYQTLLPDALGTSSVARSVLDGGDPFGIFIAVDDRPTFRSWSDPVANREDSILSGLVGSDRGHLIRFFTAMDADGDVIEGSYIGVQDYAGGSNFDYNDTVFLIKNVMPYDLGVAEDANGDGVNDALQTDRDGNGVVAFFDVNETLV